MSNSATVLPQQLQIRTTTATTTAADHLPPKAANITISTSNNNNVPPQKRHKVFLLSELQRALRRANATTVRRPQTEDAIFRDFCQEIKLNGYAIVKINTVVVVQPVSPEQQQQQQQDTPQQQQQQQSLQSETPSTPILVLPQPPSPSSATKPIVIPHRNGISSTARPSSPITITIPVLRSLQQTSPNSPPGAVSPTSVTIDGFSFQSRRPSSCGDLFKQAFQMCEEYFEHTDLEQKFKHTRNVPDGDADLGGVIGYRCFPNVREVLQLRMDSTGALVPWDINVPGFEKCIKQVHSVLEEAAITCLCVIARGLGVEPSALMELLDNINSESTKNIKFPQHGETKYASSVMWLQHYHDITTRTAHKAPRLEHTDASVLSVTPKSSVAGLQILRWHDFKWMNVEEDEENDEVCVFGGEILERLSCGYFNSTVHRVDPTLQKNRYSIPFHLRAKPTAVLDSVKLNSPVIGPVPRLYRDPVTVAELLGEE